MARQKRSKKIDKSKYWRPRYFKNQFVKWWKAKLWHRIILIIIALIFLGTSTMFGVAQWYISKHSSEPLKIGATFITPYAEYFGLDPQETLRASFEDLGLERIRLVSYWKSIEPTEGTYDFSGLDWQFDMAEEYGAEVSLSIGLRQPRWPECHLPDWAHDREFEEVKPKLYDFIEAVVSRYNNRPSLESYQLENEYFLEVFGECPDFSKERLVEELALVKAIDNDTPVIISRSNNATPSWPVRGPLPDVVGAAVYKRVWDRTITKRYFEYPLPAWYYAFLAGGGELTTGRNTVLHELQTEPWLPDKYDLRSSPISEQDKTMSAHQLDERIQYGVDTGLRTIDLWGIEWWYWRKVELKDPSVWDAGKATLERLRSEN
jgi:hypothetical protein